MSNKEDLSFLNLPKFKSFKVKSGRTYIQLNDQGDSIAVSFSSWKDEKSGDVVTGIIIRPVLKVLKDNSEACETALEAGARLDPMDKVIRKKKTFQPTHWGFASPQDVIDALEHREFFPRLVKALQEAYAVVIDADQFKNFIIVSDTALSNANVKDFREVIDIAL